VSPSASPGLAGALGERNTLRAQLLIHSFQENTSGLLELLSDGDVGREPLSPVLAVESLRDNSGVVNVVDHKVKTGHQDVAVSEELGIVGQLRSGGVGELGEQIAGRGESLEHPVK